jgi:signal transduction histidine kinase
MGVKTWQRANTTEIILAAAVWATLFAAEMVAGFALRFAGKPPTASYHFVAIGLTLALFCATPLFGKRPLANDIRALCFYDVLVEFYGLLGYLHGDSDAGYLILAQWVINLKFLRVTWPLLSIFYNIPLTWPPFGPIALLARLTRKSNANAQSPGGAEKVYLAFGVLLICAALMHLPKITEGVPVKAILTLIAGLYGTRKLIARLEAEEDEHTLTQQALGETRAHDAAKAIYITELAEKNTQLEALGAERAAMLADLAERNASLRDASHDFKIPLKSLGAWIDLAQARAPDPTTSQYLRNTENGLEELSSMMDDIIEQAKVSTALLVPTVQTQNVEELARFFDTRFREMARKRGVWFGVNRKQPFDVAANTMILRRIISNLVNNAILYSEEDTEITLWLRHSPKWAYVRIINPGAGMPGLNGPDRAANFDLLLERVKASRQTISNAANGLQGHGLGLQIVKRLCDELGTTITLYSHPDLGTCFRFRVPLAQ